MAKVNFTSGDKSSLLTLIALFVVSGETIVTGLGQRYNPWQLMHELNIGSLKKIFESLKKRFEEAQNGDPWTQTDEQKEKAAQLEKQKDLLYYIIGYRLWKAEDDKNAQAVAAIDKEIEAIKEASMTPEQRVAALEARKKELLSADEHATSTTTETPATDNK